MNVWWEICKNLLKLFAWKNSLQRFVIASLIGTKFFCNLFDIQFHFQNIFCPIWVTMRHTFKRIIECINRAAPYFIFFECIQGVGIHISITVQFGRNIRLNPHADFFVLLVLWLQGLKPTRKIYCKVSLGILRDRSFLSPNAAWYKNYNIFSASGWWILWRKRSESGFLPLYYFPKGADCMNRKYTLHN